MAALLALSACSDDDPDRSTSTASTTAIVPSSSMTAAAANVPLPDPASEIAVRIERVVDDDATAAFAEVVAATLSDPRGWSRAGFTFTVRDDAPYTIVLAEGPEVDARCAPYDTGGTYSCQLGPVVALNADRWRSATPQWPGDLASYRQMLVNHEVGHLLGQHHPVGGCTTGEPAPIMLQQSTELRRCLLNPWPLDWEVACAAARVEPLAPPYEPDATPVCGPEGP